MCQLYHIMLVIFYLLFHFLYMYFKNTSQHLKDNVLFHFDAFTKHFYGGNYELFGSLI